MKRGAREITTPMPLWEAVYGTYFIAKDGQKIETSGHYQTEFPSIDELKEYNNDIQIRWNFSIENNMFVYDFITVPNIEKQTLINNIIPQYIIDEIWNY